MLKTLSSLCLAVILLAASAVTTRADLAQVGPINLQNGYPLWWMDANGTQVEICLDAANCPLFDPAQPSPFSQQIGFGAEAFWWAAGADVVNPVGVGLFELAMEAAFLTETAAPGDQLPFVRLRARFDVAATGTYTLTYPFGTLSVNVATVGAGPEINETIDIPGTAADVPPFAGALTTGVPPVAAGATHGVSNFFRALAPASPVGFMGVPGAASTIDLAASGIASADFTITGPAGAFGAVNTLTNAGLWDVAGKLFIPGVNVAPVANPDLKATAVATPVTFNVVNNDLDAIVAGVNDHGLNPKAVALGSDTVNLLANAIGASRTRDTAQGGTALINADGSLTYTPPPTFSGVDSFPYLVQDTGGLVATTSAIVVVEQLTNQASFRPKLQKWDIGGSTSVVNLTTVDGATLFTNLTGAQEVPAFTSAGQGDVSLTLRPGADLVLGTNDDLIDFTLNYSGLTAVQQSHIHSGTVGNNGPVNIFLCTNQGNAPVGGATIPACPTTAGTVTGTRTIADLQAQAGAAVETFPQLIAAIQAGNSYVNVHTAAAPGGELRGQVGRNVVAVHSGPTASAPVLGVVAVPPIPGGQQVATWSLSQKLGGTPSADRTLTIQTSAGNSTTVPLKIH